MRNSAVYAVPEAAGAGRLVTKAWHLTAVTVREGAGRAELAALCRVSHPGILLLMAVSPGPQDQLQLVFQHVPLGPLHHWLHVQVRHTYRWKRRFIQSQGRPQLGLQDTMLTNLPIPYDLHCESASRRFQQGLSP